MTISIPNLFFSNSSQTLGVRGAAILLAVVHAKEKTMFQSIAVANEFIAISLAKNNAVTPMKLLKLVYFAHGWHLGIYDRPLIDEQVEAWKYGPVVDSIYHEVKSYGTNKINSLIERTRFTNSELITEVPRIDLGDPNGDRALALIKRVWKVYSPHTGIKLSNMTHQTGTPWFKVWNAMDFPIKGTDIPEVMIKDHFSELARG